LVPVQDGSATALRGLATLVNPNDLREVYETWLAGKAEHTRRAYAKDWIDVLVG
ncbi:MAG: hypothetical protein HY262_02880, partial [Chloroflexi bacterium]|nr:hypothetical protein [Chloroflexota bacterium]